MLLPSGLMKKSGNSVKMSKRIVLGLAWSWGVSAVDLAEAQRYWSNLRSDAGKQREKHSGK